MGSGSRPSGRESGRRADRPRASRDRGSRWPCRWDHPGRRNTPGPCRLRSLADANKDLGNIGLEPRPGFEHADRPANRHLRRRLGLVVQVAVDQPVAKPRRLEPINLEAVADRNLGEKPTVGRAKQQSPSTRRPPAPGQGSLARRGARPVSSLGQIPRAVISIGMHTSPCALRSFLGRASSAPAEC